MSTALLAPAAVDRELVQVGDWHPCAYTPTLTGTEDFVTDGDRLIAAAHRYWSDPQVERFRLDPWQQWLIRHILERYPDDWPVVELRGRFRYRQVVVSMGRQNGKSVLGALFGFYGLVMHVRGPLVIGVASNREQANIVYDRVKYAVGRSPQLKAMLKATGTRGIAHRDGSGAYEVRPSKGEALQGLPISLCPFDELHIAPAELWGAVVNGQRSRPDALVLGITTAGDDDSELLKGLYEQGKRSIAGDPEHERFGFFLWEAPEGATIEDDAAIIAANPAVACGRVSLATVKSDARLLPEPDQQRYTLNRWISSTNAWLPMGPWLKYAGTAQVDQNGLGLVLAVERTMGWEHATITATQKRDGLLHTEVVASLARPTIDRLADVAERLRARTLNATWAVDSLTLGALGKLLKGRGFDVRFLHLSDATQAASSAYANIVQGNVRHGGDALLARQMPRGRRRNVGDSWRISRADSTDDIDAVLSTVYGLYVADTTDAVGGQVF